MTPTPPASEMEERIDEILLDYRSAVAGVCLEHYSKGTTTQELIAIDKEAKAAVAVLLAEARINGFRDAQIACSFNKDCKHCEANSLTLAYLGEPAAFSAVREKGHTDE